MPPQDCRQDLTTTGFNLLESEIRFLIKAFGSVLRRLGEDRLADQLPWNGGQVVTPEASDQAFGQATSIAFQLLNIVEERVAAQIRRMREKVHGPEAEKGLWPDKLRQIRALALDDDALLSLLDNLHVEPVLTAHPTEAKPESVRERHREIYKLMQAHENQNLTPREQTRIRERIEAVIESLWRTGEIHVTRPSIRQERENTLYYLREILPEALLRTQRHFQEAWRATGGAPGAAAHAAAGIQFGSWVGGDRDGHPLVTADVTADTLRALRVNTLRVLARHLDAAAYHLPLSKHFKQTPKELLDLITRLAEAVESERAANLTSIIAAHREHPWRAAALMMRQRVLAARDFLPGGTAYATPEQLDSDLAILESTLQQNGATALADQYIAPVRTLLRTLGFHGARLDIRQNSAFHDAAIAQLLAKARIPDGENWTDWTPEAKQAFLLDELATPRPFLPRDTSAGPEADAVLSTYRVLSQHIAAHGAGALGALIVSMTRHTADLLAVYLLAREAGLLEIPGPDARCPLPVVPLFETIDDLENAPHILNAFLQHPITRAGTAAGNTIQVMLGYSDSNKDCGILASQWALHSAQTRLTSTICEAGFQPLFFHGRGGTVGRGAGPTHWFMEALPQGSLATGLRMTEQGETIARKYGHTGAATYNLELLVASAAAAKARHLRNSPRPAPCPDIMRGLAAWSRESYTALLHSPGFLDFHRQATPIDALENANIGSRPARRSGRATFEDLRAIPWVFSWTQARFYLPGWYGTGTALEQLQQQNPEGFDTLAEALKNSPFARFVFTNIESSVASANPDLMRAYATLADTPDTVSSPLNTILREYERTRSLLHDLFGGTFDQRRPRLARTLAIREAPLRTLHLQQIELLRTWRQHLADNNTPAANSLLPNLLVSVNAIASGLRTTG